MNTNILEGFICPHCDSEEEFEIEVKVLMDFTDGGGGDHGDAEWEDSSHCMCKNCDHIATVKDFCIE